MKSIEEMSFEELFKLHDSNIVAGLTIHSFKAAEKTRQEIFTRFADQKAKIAELEKQVEDLEIMKQRQIELGTAMQKEINNLKCCGNCG